MTQSTPPVVLVCGDDRDAVRQAVVSLKAAQKDTRSQFLVEYRPVFNKVGTVGGYFFGKEVLGRFDAAAACLVVHRGSSLLSNHDRDSVDDWIELAVGNPPFALPHVRGGHPGFRADSDYCAPLPSEAESDFAVNQKDVAVLHWHEGATAVPELSVDSTEFRTVTARYTSRKRWGTPSIRCALYSCNQDELPAAFAKRMHIFLDASACIYACTVGRELIAANRKYLVNNEACLLL